MGKLYPIIYIIYGIKIIFTWFKIFFYFIGLGGWLSLILMYFNFFHGLWWVIAVIMQNMYNYDWLAGTLGYIVGSCKELLWAYYGILFLFIFYFIYGEIHNVFFFSNLLEYLNFNFLQNNNIIYLQLFLKNLSLKTYSIKYYKNSLFFQIKIIFYKTKYPIHTLYYDINQILPHGFFKIHLTHYKDTHDLVINIINPQTNTSSYLDLKKKKLFYCLTHWFYGFSYLFHQRNYYFFGVNSFNQLMLFNLHDFYNVFILDTYGQLSIEYNNKYLFKDLIQNQKNIIYIINQKVHDNLREHYQYIVKLLENCFVQSKINNKNIIIFLYYQLEPFKDIKMINYIKLLIKNSIGRFHIIIIENNSHTLIKFFYQSLESFLGQNSCLLFSGFNNLSHSYTITKQWGYESKSNIWGCMTKNKTYHCKLWDLN